MSMGQRVNILLGLVAVVLAAAPTASGAADSTCYGTTAEGKLEHGCKLPYGGDNFTAYSRLGSTLGRTYVHCKVAEVVLAAYKELKEEQPDRVFVFGETGWASGGRFKPHKTHQNGLSIDFMAPVVDRSGKSVPIPGTLSTGMVMTSNLTRREARVSSPSTSKR